MTGGGVVRVLCLLGPLLAGGSSNNQPKNEPPLGLNAPPLPREGPKTAQGGGPDKPLPALTSPNGATSQAALAAGAVTQLDGGRDLRIGERDQVASWQGKTTGAVLGKPTLPSDTLTPPPMQPITQTGGVPAAISSVDQGLQALDQRGVKGFRLEQQRDSGLWRCTCSIPSPTNPNFKQIYDKSAADALSALRAVLDQIERDMH